jgi:RNA polymerase sigma-70 factor (ECF subfamily)
MALLRSARNDVGEGRGASAVGSFEGVYAEYVGFVWRCLRTLGVPEASIDDAAQDVFVVVHRRLEDFRGESSLRTWLYGIVRNVAANQRRSRRRKGGAEPLDAELPSDCPPPDERAQAQQALSFVQAFAAQLDDKKRDLFVLALVEELSIPEVASILNIPLNTAYTRLRSVRQAFHLALEAERNRP